MTEATEAMRAKHLRREKAIFKKIGGDGPALVETTRAGGVDLRIYTSADAQIWCRILAHMGAAEASVLSGRGMTEWDFVCHAETFMEFMECVLAEEIATAEEGADYVAETRRKGERFLLF
jgi:hypothetical protein